MSQSAGIISKKLFTLRKNVRTSTTWRMMISSFSEHFPTTQKLYTKFDSFVSIFRHFFLPFLCVRSWLLLVRRISCVHRFISQERHPAAEIAAHFIPPIFGKNIVVVGGKCWRQLMSFCAVDNVISFFKSFKIIKIHFFFNFKNVINFKDIHEFIWRDRRLKIACPFWVPISLKSVTGEFEYKKEKKKQAANLIGGKIIHKISERLSRPPVEKILLNRTESRVTADNWSFPQSAHLPPEIGRHHLHLDDFSQSEWFMFRPTFSPESGEIERVWLQNLLQTAITALTYGVGSCHKSHRRDL